ncbi:hypothetical protein TNCV_2683561 [Trichonephila clavipes]|nr:hypothetical protein TNCV_2683561 [Trichonephila clavipes]
MEEVSPIVREKYQEVYSQCRSDRLFIDPPCGLRNTGTDIISVETDFGPGGNNDGWYLDKGCRVQTRDLRQLELLGRERDPFRGYKWTVRKVTGFFCEISKMRSDLRKPIKRGCGAAALVNEPVIRGRCLKKTMW